MGLSRFTVKLNSMLILFCLVLTGCNSPNEISYSSTSDGSYSENSNLDSPKEASNITSSVSKPETQLYDLDYDDYFSKERIWIDESNLNESGYHYTVNSDGTVTRFIFSGYGKYGNSLKTDETIICKDIGFVNERITVYGDPIFVVDKHRIIQTNPKGDDPKMIYEDSGSISHIRATRELIYFVREGAEHTLSRLHRQSGRVDEMFTTKDPIHHYYALSNYAVRWYTATPEFAAFEKTGLPDEEAPSDLIAYNGFLFNAKTKEHRRILDSDYDADGFFIYNIQEY